MNGTVNMIDLPTQAEVYCSDGIAGRSTYIIGNPIPHQVTHLVLLERHIFQKREITIPVSQIDHIDESTVYLKPDRQGVEAQPTTPVERWPHKDFPGPRLFPLSNN
jgi:hypothetical protein